MHPRGNQKVFVLTGFDSFHV